MIDKDKVLKGLECCSESISKACPMECPYRVECLMQDDTSHMYSVMHDALELLKDEPSLVLNIVKFNCYHGDCPACGKRIHYNFTKYCPRCGKRVKWE